MPVDFVTGGSRGVGEATAYALAELGHDIGITFRNKESRAEDVVQNIRALGRSAVAFGGDMTLPEVREDVALRFSSWYPSLNALVLNASGGLEGDLLAERPDYPLLINRDAQVGMVAAMRQLLARDSTLAFITSHWAHMYGEIEQMDGYEPIAESKHLGEKALREQLDDLDQDGIRLLVITGDLVEDTITARLLGRKYPGLAESRREESGRLITTTDMGNAIAKAIVDPSLPTGSTVVVGAPLETLQ